MRNKYLYIIFFNNHFFRYNSSQVNYLKKVIVDILTFNIGYKIIKLKILYYIVK